MKISLPVLVIALHMCVPSAAHAALGASGTIYFVGSIVESRHCQVTKLGIPPSARPQVSCSTREGLLTPATEAMVKVSTSNTLSNMTTMVDTMHLRQVVTLEYR